MRNMTAESRSVPFDWCDENLIELIKLSSILWKSHEGHGNVVIKNEDVEIVSNYKYFGTVIDNKLTGSLYNRYMPMTLNEVISLEI